MKHLLKSVAIASAVFLLLTLVLWAINLQTFSSSPPNQVMTQLFVLLALAPFGISGYLGGRLAQRHGLFVGLIANIVGVILLGTVFFQPVFDSDPSIYILGILIAWLAGGVGELHAVRIKRP